MDRQRRPPVLIRFSNVSSWHRFMPIRFTCSHCQQSLSVADAKAELEVTCPNCRRVVVAPAVNQPPSRTPPPLPPDGTTSATDPFAQFAVHDSDPELVYGAEECAGHASGR